MMNQQSFTSSAGPLILTVFTVSTLIGVFSLQMQQNVKQKKSVNSQKIHCALPAQQ